MHRLNQYQPNKRASNLIQASRWQRSRNITSTKHCPRQIRPSHRSRNIYKWRKHHRLFRKIHIAAIASSLWSQLLLIWGLKVLLAYRSRHRGLFLLATLTQRNTLKFWRTRVCQKRSSKRAVSKLRMRFMTASGTATMLTMLVEPSLAK